MRLHPRRHRLVRVVQCRHVWVPSCTHVNDPRWFPLRNVGLTECWDADRRIQVDRGQALEPEALGYFDLSKDGEPGSEPPPAPVEESPPPSLGWGLESVSTDEGRYESDVCRTLPRGPLPRLKKGDEPQLEVRLDGAEDKLVLRRGARRPEVRVLEPAERARGRDRALRRGEGTTGMGPPAETVHDFVLKWLTRRTREPSAPRRRRGTLPRTPRPARRQAGGAGTRRPVRGPGRHAARRRHVPGRALGGEVRLDGRSPADVWRREAPGSGPSGTPTTPTPGGPTSSP